jgi:Xaa-Pro aminopeptidase
MNVVSAFAGRALPKETAFPEAEFGGRLARARAAMDQAGLDMLLVHYLPNICYLTGYESHLTDWYACLLLPREGDLALQVCNLEVGLAVVYTTIRNIHQVPWNDMSKAGEQLAELLRDYRVEGRRVGVEERRPGLNAHTYKILREHFPHTHFRDASDLVLKLRIVKSAAEVDCMRRAARFTVAGVEAAVAAAELGAMDNAIVAAASQVMLAAGSEFFTTGPMVRSGYRTGIMHAEHRRRKVAAGEPITMELSGVYHRYHAPLFATAVIGAPSERLRRLADQALQIIAALLETIRPGLTMDDVCRAMTKHLKSVDPEVYLSGYHGYSVGIGFPPAWPEHSAWIGEGSAEVLVPGMTFHVPRVLRVPGLMAAGFSETVLVTETGCEVLTPHRRELRLV